MSNEKPSIGGGSADVAHDVSDQEHFLRLEAERNALPLSEKIERYHLAGQVQHELLGTINALRALFEHPSTTLDYGIQLVIERLFDRAEDLIGGPFWATDPDAIDIESLRATMSRPEEVPHG